MLDQVFPEYRGVFGDLYSIVSLLTLLEFPTSNDVLAANKGTLASKIKEYCKIRSSKWPELQTAILIAVASRNPFQKNLYESHILSLEMYVKMLLKYQKHLSKLEYEIDALAKEINEYKIIQAIPRIGEKTAATTISEIDGTDRFNHPKKS